MSQLISKITIEIRCVFSVLILGFYKLNSIIFDNDIVSVIVSLSIIMFIKNLFLSKYIKVNENQ